MHENKKIYRNITDAGLPPILESLAKAESLRLPLLKAHGIEADVLRLDQIHPVIAGNKWFKLKYYLRNALDDQRNALLTFGGPYSNHIAATACAARIAGLSSIGVIRGEEPPQLSHTLLAARRYGMKLQFVSRTEYERKTDPSFLRLLASQYPQAALIPEGGAGNEGIRGSQEILDLVNKETYSHIACAVGTATTFLGLAEASLPHQEIIGISALKGLQKEPGSPLPVDTGALSLSSKKDYCRISGDYHFGGYAKKSKELFQFMNDWYRDTAIPADFVYTAKLFYGILDMVQKNHFPPGSRLLLVHSGGLQGNLSLDPGTLSFQTPYSGPDFE